MIAKPLNLKLYEQVKKLANKKFNEKSSIYKSSWIVKEYKKRGGKYQGTRNKNKGLLRWYKEKWVDLNRSIKNSSGKIIGYEPCGRNSKKNGSYYPLCRPSVKVTKDTPKTYQEVSSLKLKKLLTLKRKNKDKIKVKF